MTVRLGNDQPSRPLGQYASRVLSTVINNPVANLHASVPMPSSLADPLTEGQSVNELLKVTHDPSVARPLFCSGPSPKKPSRRPTHFAFYRLGDFRLFVRRSGQHASGQISALGAAVNRLVNSGALPHVWALWEPVLTPVFLPSGAETKSNRRREHLSLLRPRFPAHDFFGGAPLAASVRW